MRTLFLIAFTFAAGASGLHFVAFAQAQPAAAKSGKSEDLRAVYATSLEVAEGKRVAEASCVRCHGLDGISKTKGVPHVAGQRPAYLHLELRAYQTGVRGEKAMDGVVKYMSDDALVKVAAYYASLDPPQPAAAPSGKPAPAKPDPVQAGKSAAAGCGGCHGEGGISKIPGMPSLVSFAPKYLVAAMKAYKGGQRKHDMMKSLLGAVSDADMDNVALYYALQKPARAQTPVTGNPTAGKAAAAAAACAGCHGNLGVSGNPITPSLAGQDAQYLAAAIKEYKDGSRSDDTMKGPVASLDDRAMKDLAAFYATQQPQPPNVRAPLTVAEWAQRCDRCHGVNGNSTDPLSPALAGQRQDYLEKVLHDYRTRARKSPPMAAMSDVLAEVDIENLAAHYARQKARAVVFVIPQATREK
ncbi:MAG: c-type cytochrome [Betaproteobacteria bacterium]|nr:c-type cytochrome [Betaproteobacteria bacterium]